MRLTYLSHIDSILLIIIIVSLQASLCAELIQGYDLHKHMR